MDVRSIRTSDRGRLAPLEVARKGVEEPPWIGRATMVFIILGVLIRLVRYLVDYPIWHDEAFLAVNFWDRGYSDLLRPLDYIQVAPWLFLCIERTAVILFGYSELSLRLFPTLCGIAGVFLFRHLAGRLLSGLPLMLAMAIFATAFYPIRHGAEIKPYSSDLLASLVLLALAVESMRDPGQSRWWWIMAAVSPLLLALSYPAVFVGSGISLTFLVPVWGTHKPGVRIAYLAYCAVAGISFAAIYLASTTFQAGEVMSYYRYGYWARSFPPLDRPWLIPVWLLERHTGTMMAYPVGENHGGSAGTLACVAIGCLALWRRDRRFVMALLLAPAGMGLLAAVLGKYPYGGAPRIMLYLTPSICLLMGLGVAALLVRIREVKRARRVIVELVTCLALLGMGLIVRDLGWPYRIHDDVRTREFARRFWTEGARTAELACIKSDFGLILRHNQWGIGMSAVYLFHQRMFSERHQQKRPLDLDPSRYNTQRPLKIVLFDDLPRGNPVFEGWLAGLGRNFELKRTETFVIHPGKSGETWLRDAYNVMEFAPREGPASLARGGAGRAVIRSF